MLREVPKLTTSPFRPVYPIEARLDGLRKRQREIVDLIIAAEQSGDKSAAYSDDDAKVEREARALVRSEVEAKKPLVASATLKALLHERAVNERALQIGTAMLTDLRMAWAQQVMAERSKEYRDRRAQCCPRNRVPEKGR